MSTIEFGKKVPIRLLISDLNALRYVQAKIYDQDSALIQTFNLGNLGNGRYTYEAYTMPSSNFITVVYTVFSDDNYSVVDDKYTSDIDIFIKAGNDALEALIRNKSQNLSQVEAFVEAKTFSGEISNTKKLEADINKNVLEHGVLNLKLEGEIDVDQLEGAI
jgi:hypothetical protein